LSGQRGRGAGGAASAEKENWNDKETIRQRYIIVGFTVRWYPGSLATAYRRVISEISKVFANLSADML